MLEKLRIVFTIPELRQKILLTLGLLAIYRVGWQVPLPIIDPKAMSAFAEETGGIGDLLRTVAVFSASQLSQATIFGLGIISRIACSISAKKSTPGVMRIERMSASAMIAP